MSEDKVDRRAKKAQRDAERKKSGKKRKHEEVEDEGAKDELKQDFISLDVSKEESKVPSKKRKADAIDPDTTATAREQIAPKKKRRKSSKPAPNGEAGTQEDGETNYATAKPTKSRFILFIGNLPYTATDDTINAHFIKIKPFHLRHRTDPKTKKSKGFAFLEFEDYDRMKTCLKLYHHSTFDPSATEAGADAAEPPKDSGGRGRRKKDQSRKINVELTAGGGGKGGERKEKIKVKNQRLEEQRARRKELEMKEALKAEKKKGKKMTGANGAVVGEQAADGPGVGGGAQMESMNPSRLAMLQGR